jgi:copper chaperone
MAVFRLPEIFCETCVRALTGAVRALDKHATVQADLITKLVRVDAAASDDAVAAALREAGFSVEPSGSRT